MLVLNARHAASVSHRAGSASSARLSASTLTRGSPRKPELAALGVRGDQRATVRGGRGRARARRGGTWQCAAAGLMCGSSPLPEAVTRSTGIGRVVVRVGGARARRRAPSPRRPAPGWAGPRFEPDDAAALYASGAVAESRPQKYFGSSNGWPMSAEPTTLAVLRTIRLPLAWRGKAACAIAGDERAGRRRR